MGSVIEGGHYGYLNSTNSTASGSIVDNNYTAIERNAADIRGANFVNVTPNNIDSFINDHGIYTGTFDDIYLGDYFKITYDGTTFTMLVADFDPYWGIEESGIAYTHHICVVPVTYITTSYMNTTVTTSGGYSGSYMNSTTIPTINTKLSAIFGDHLLTYKDKLTTDKSGSTGELTSVQSILMSEIELLGTTTYSCDTYKGLLTNQLSLFAKDSSYINIHYSYLLRDIHREYSSYYSVYCYTDGSLSYVLNNADARGVRPRFLLG